jgi:hypothetical protein
MFKNSLFSFILFLIGNSTFAQDGFSKYSAFGIELQQYPTGFLLGARGEFGFKPHQSFDFRIGYNFVDHRDQGKHANEEGGGFGFTLGYRYYFKPQNTHFFLGIRSDLWFNKIDWQDDPNLSGTTEVVVLQPTIIGGYLFLIKEKWTITPTLAFGYEINIVENGDPVGQGPIFLWGLNVNYRLVK